MRFDGEISAFAKSQLEFEVNLLIAKNDLASCRADLEARLGQRIMLKSNGGRRRRVFWRIVHQMCLLFAAPSVRRTANTFVSAILTCLPKW